ncbi:RHS repeat-associated core domain-containing protein [Corynebacterium macclintockiae]
MCDLAGARQELINTTTGVVEGHTTQTLYGKRTWVGRCTSPLLFAGQYEDAESGWVYNRFRYYNPTLGAYNAQDPLGLAPRLASAQGYVDHAAYWVDVLGLHSGGHFTELKRASNPVEEYRGRRWRLGEHPMDPMRNGNPPSHSTENKRFWKNEAQFNSEQYAPENGFADDTIDRMRQGKPPQRFNQDKLDAFPQSDGIESMEVSHEPIARSEGGVQTRARWPQEHADIDPQRFPGY